MKQFYFTILFCFLTAMSSAQNEDSNSAITELTARPISASTTPTGNSAEVGVTEGSLSISLTGNASYSIPVITPPGINNFEPQISIIYNSQRGLSGTAAIGWDISGVSTISRIPATKFHDGRIDPVDFNSFDRFALDGQRLIVKNGTSGGYGANGTIYETEYFSNTKITSYGVHPNGANFGPAYFIVEYPDGTKAYYGYSSDSKSITEWSLTFIENAQGVRISYEYTSSNNCLYISSIKYGSQGATAPINEVQFVYGTREILDHGYIGGLYYKRDKNLKNINVISSGSGFRNYVFGYQYQDKISSVTEKNGDNTKSYNPTKFEYDRNISNQVDYIRTNNTNSVDVGNITSLNFATVSGDFDGDGNMDFILHPTTGASAKAKYWLYTDASPSTPFSMSTVHNVGAFSDIFASTYVNSAGQLGSNQGWTVIQGNSFTTYYFNSIFQISQNDQKIFTFPRFVLDYQYQCTGGGGGGINLNETELLRGPINPPGPIDVHYERDIPRRYISGDFNGDGITDVVAIEKSFTYPYRYMCTQYSSTYQGGRVFLINLDKRITSNFASAVGDLATTDSSDIRVADFNGDGKSDIFVFDEGKVKIYSLNYNATQFTLLFQTTVNDPNIMLSRPILLGDYNGDGKTDFMLPKAYGSSNWYRYLSRGADLVKDEVSSSIIFTANDSYHTHNYISIDINNDSKTDIIWSQSFRNTANTVGSVTVYCYPNNNGSFVVSSIPWASTGDQADINIYALPVYLPVSHQTLKNGIYTTNSTLQVAFLNQNKIHYFSYQSDYIRDNLLTNITLGNGMEQAISYIPLNSLYKNTYNTIYTPSLATASYPNLDIKISPNLFVVSKIEQKSKDVYRKKLFGYYGAVSNVEGLGFLGFRSVTQTNWHDDTTRIFTTITKNDVDLRGAVTQTAVVPYLSYPYPGSLPSDFTTRSTISYNNLTESPLLGNKVWRLKPTNLQELNSLNDTSSETTDIVYDIDNNITSSTTLLKQGATLVQSRKTDIDYAVPTVSPFYIVGRPSSKTVTVTADSHTMATTEVYSYNGQQLLVNTDKSALGTSVISEGNEYDGFGNVIKKTITAPIPLLPRETRYEYDLTGRFVTKVTDNDNKASLFDYDSNGLLKKETDPYNLSKSYTYDSWCKNLTITDDQLSRVFSNTYTANGEKTIVTTTMTSPGLDTSFSENLFDDLGRKIRSGVKGLNGNFAYTSYLYDIYNRNYKTSEPYFGSIPSQWNEVKFDQYGRTTDATLFNGRITSNSYPPSSLSSTFTDGQKSKVINQNVIGNITSTTETIGGGINYRYFANGKIRKTTYNGIDINMEQNGWGNKTKITYPSAGTYNYDYNDLGELTSETVDNSGIVTSITRDLKTGRPVTKTVSGSGSSSTTTYTYDGGLPLTIDFTDNNGLPGYNRILTTMSYDSYKRISSIIEERFNHSRFTRTFTYDAFGRISSEIKLAEVGGVRSYVFTQNKYKNGELYQIVDEANKVLWQTNNINSKGQVLEAVAGNGIMMSNTYNSDGYLSKMKYDKISTGFNILTLDTEFDKNTDNLISRSNSAFGNYTETFEYDALDRLTKFTNKIGVQETQSYDASGKILSNNLGTYEYDPLKKYQNTSITLSSEATGYYAGRAGIYNDSMEDGSGFGLSRHPNDIFFSYDEALSHTGKYSLKLENTLPTEKYVHSDKWIAIDNAEDTQYTYSAWVYSDNPQAQMFLFMKTDTEVGYATAVDNIVTDVKNSWFKMEQTVTVPAHIKKLNIRLDNNGSGNVWFDDVQIRKTSDPSSSERNLNVSYDASKRPIEIEETNVDNLLFQYNDANQRSIMSYGGFQPQWHLRPLHKFYSADGSMQVNYNRNTNTFEFITYIGGDGYSAPVVVKSNGTVPNYLYLHRDYQGSILAVSNDNGDVVEKRLFDAWGNIIKVQDGFGNTLNGLTVLDRGYTGHEHLQSIGLINMNARLYDPLLHRFLQTDNYIQDPSNTQNYNQYGYVFNNPLKYTDPSGNVSQGPGKDCVDCGWGSTIANGITTLAQNWDNWRIKDWANKNINGHQFSEWWKNKVSFRNLFGGGHKDAGPPPNMSRYTNISDTRFITTSPSLVKFNEYKKDYKQWVNKSLVARLLSGRPENPYMIASSGGLDWISGGGAVKFVKYSGEALSALKKTEAFYGAAQSETAIAEIIAKMKAGNPSIFSEPIYTYAYKDAKYIVDGHHRIEAAIRSGGVIEAIELTGMGISSHFTKNLLKIEEILAGWHF